MGTAYTTDYSLGVGMFHKHPGILKAIKGIDATAFVLADDKKAVISRYITAGNDANTVMLLNMDTDFTDSSLGASVVHTPTVVGATIDTVEKFFGAGAGSFDGLTDYVSYPNSADWAFGNNNFTFDCRFRRSGTAIGKWIFNKKSSFGVRVDTNTIHARFLSVESGNVSFDSSIVVLDNNWHHLAYVRNGEYISLYYDGILIGQNNIGTDTLVHPGSTDLILGARMLTAPTPEDYWEGQIDEARFSNTARFTGSTLVPATEAYSDGVIKTYSLQSTLFIDDDNKTVGIGISASTAKLHIVGDDDIVQLLVQSHSTQTSDVVRLQDHLGVKTLNITTAGSVYGVTSFFTHQIGTSSLQSLRVISVSDNLALEVQNRNFSAERNGVEMSKGIFSQDGVHANAVVIMPTYNQTNAASATDLLINRTETAVGTGNQRLIDAQVGGVSKFHVNTIGLATIYGSLELPIEPKDADFTLDGTMHTVELDGSSNTVIASLPDATTCKGRVYYLKAVDLTFQVDVSTFGTQTIDGVSTNFVFASQWDSLTIQSNGSNWVIL